MRHPLHEDRTAADAARGCVLDAARLVGAARATGGEATYRIVEPAPRAAPADQRGIGRVRTRLRSGKVLDGGNRFLGECILHDRSPRGSRIRLHEDIALPTRIRFYDDERGGVFEAEIVWRSAQDVGIRLASSTPITSVRQAELARLAGRYYAAETGSVPALRSR